MVQRTALYERLLGSIAVRRVAARPDRFERRLAKRSPKRYDRLTRARAEIKLRMLKRVSEISVPFGDRTEARNATNRIAVGVSGLRALGPSACARS